MANISDDAYILLKTSRKNALKTWGGKVFDKSRIAAWYNEDEEGEEWMVNAQSLIDELVAARLIGYEDKDDTTDGYRITPKGENYTPSISDTPSIVQSFSDIHGSNIANMSSHSTQTIDLSSYSIEIQNEIAELKEAIRAKDDARAKRITDGLWVSAPSLILQLLQLGLSIEAIGK